MHLPQGAKRNVCQCNSMIPNHHESAIVTIVQSEAAAGAQ